ncbi:hypothetical protein EDC55_1326 [Allofrancisella inopinata]|uniref:Uncharacterized protein n=1 Tax=Allofrancisella inopinata TaxID=1085647 RepID=A0AAE6YJ92_9GAMM|nr:hypothetical protein [Allofrancisella inopinata]QIV96487.1 hypothetical protein E4K63_06440 [Allofrancisella inopinata]TDT66694.1 hypothetical protein EDC55_1326 [Allofrancisella inopinata]
MDDKNISLSQQEYINLMAHKITHDVVAETRVDIDRLGANVDKRFGEFDKKFNEFKTDVDKRFGEFDKKINEFKTDVDKKFGEFDKKINEFKTDVDRRFIEVDKRFDRLTSLLYWIVGIGITSIALPIVMPLIKNNLNL